MEEIYDGEYISIFARKINNNCIQLIGWTAYGSVLYSTSLTKLNNNWTLSVPWAKKLNDGQENKYNHPNYNSYGSGLYKISVDELGHVSKADSVTKQDIINLGIAEDNNITIEFGQVTAWGNTVIDDSYCVKYGKVAIVHCSGTYGNDQDIPKDTSLFSLPWAINRESDYHLRGELTFRVKKELSDVYEKKIVDGYYIHQYKVIGSNESISNYKEFTFRMIYITN